MSKLKRYTVNTFDNYQEAENGFWVKAQDVQQLEAELEQKDKNIKNANDEANELSVKYAELERELDAAKEANRWIPVSDAELEDGMEYVVSDGSHIAVAKYWKAVNKWICSDVRIANNTEVLFVIPKPIQPPQEV